VREEKDGERRKKAKESRVVPHPKLNPGCATASETGPLSVCVTCTRRDPSATTPDILR